jgi:DNA polymerase III epsilon subunit-like protein
MAAVDIETTGSVVGYHEIIQIAIVPLTPDLDPWDKAPFYMDIRPDFPERAEPDAMRKNGLVMEELMLCPDAIQVADCLEDYWNWINLPVDKRLIPLTQNGFFDIPFIKHWLGDEAFYRYFSWLGRDTMQYAISMNDEAAWKNHPIPFDAVGLKPLCKKFGVALDKHHDALEDAIATGKIYRELMRYET